MRLPDYLTRLSPVGETLAAMETEEALLTEDSIRRNAQLSVSTAESGLTLWEADYALPSHGTTAERRARILSAMAGEQTLTVEALTALAAGICTPDHLEVEEDFDSYQVMIHLLYHERMPENAAALEALLEECKPAHLQVKAVPALSLRGTLKHNLALTGAVYLELQDGQT